jgi:tetratricopeptide (TPR) repeat protein
MRISINPEEPRAWLTKGFLLSELGYYKKSVECFDKAIKLDAKIQGRSTAKDHSHSGSAIIESPPRIREILSTTLMGTEGVGGITDDESTLRDYRPIKTDESTRTDSKTRFLEELYACEIRLNKNLKDKDSWYSRALLLARMGRSKEALTSLHKVTFLDDKYPNVWNLKSKLFMKLGNRKNADYCNWLAQRNNEGDICASCFNSVPSKMTSCTTCGSHKGLEKP